MTISIWIFKCFIGSNSVTIIKDWTPSCYSDNGQPDHICNCHFWQICNQICYSRTKPSSWKWRLPPPLECSRLHHSIPAPDFSITVLRFPISIARHSFPIFSHLPHFPSTVTHIRSAEFHRWSVLLHRRQGWVLHSSRRKLESLLLFHCPPLQFPRQVNNLVPWYSCTFKIVWFVISWLFRLKCVTEWGFFAALEFQPSIFLALLS